MKTSLKVSDIGEKELIERIIEKSKSCSIGNGTLSHINNSNSSFSTDFKTSIGDDSALINQSLDSNSYIVASSDMLIQSTHFPREMSFYQMGYKSVVVNVSDLSSMGAENIAFLLNIAVPKDMLLDDFDDFICGVVHACDKYAIPLVGGDTNESSEIIVSGTAIGSVDKNHVLMKHGFREGDLVCISDSLGYAALGFELLKLKNNNAEKYNKITQEIKETDPTIVDLAIFKALKVEAKYDEGRILASYNTEDNRVSATDITDGLASEFYELLNADKKFNDSLNSLNSLNTMDNGLNNTPLNSQDGLKSNDNNNSDICLNNYNKGMRIYEDKLPIEDAFKEISSLLGIDYLDLFLHIGEDFELLFTVNRELEEKLINEMNFYVIGEITNNNTVEIVLSNGTIENISPKGYQHLI